MGPFFLSLMLMFSIFQFALSASVLEKIVEWWEDIHIYHVLAKLIMIKCLRNSI